MALVASIVFAIPVIIIVLGSIRQTDQPPPRSLELPEWPPALGNFSTAMQMAGLSRGLVNSVIVAAIFVPLSIVVASWAGLAIVRLPPRRRARWIGLTAVAFLVPITVVMLGRFYVFRSAGISGTFLPLLAPALLGGSPLFVLIYVWAFRRVPAAYFEVATIEGTGALGLWWRVAMPMVWPITAGVAVLAFLLSWNDVLAPLLYLSDPSTFTLPLAMRVLAGVDPNNLPVMLAGALIATVPVVFALGGFNAILARVIHWSER